MIVSLKRIVQPKKAGDESVSNRIFLILHEHFDIGAPLRYFFGVKTTTSANRNPELGLALTCVLTLNRLLILKCVIIFFFRLIT
jgi:hypothetical protein